MASPLGVLKEAAEKTPALNYAYGVIGLAAAAAAVLSYFHSWAFAVVGILLLLIGMVLVWAVEMLQRGGNEARDPPVRIIVWSAVVFFVGVLGLMVSAATFGRPQNIAGILGVMVPPTQEDIEYDNRMIASLACPNVGHIGVLSDHFKSLAFRESCLGLYCKAIPDEERCPSRSASRDHQQPSRHTSLFHATIGIFPSLISPALADPPPLPYATRRLTRATSLQCNKTALGQQPDTRPILGADISHLNKIVDWNGLRKAGYYFVYIKASQGTQFADPAFVVHWQAAGRAGLLRGAYHTLAGGDAWRQATNFLSALAKVEMTSCDLGAALDLENPPPGTKLLSSDQVAAAKVWLEIVKVAQLRRPALYTNYDYFAGELDSPGGFEEYPLWIASYRPSEPRVPKPWSSYALWQFTDGYSAWPPLLSGNSTAQAFSMTNRIGTTYFNGTASELFELGR